MLNSLNETVKQLLLKKGAIDTGVIDISFETPDREWSASISKPTINIYLYDIRENHRLRSTEWTINKDENGYATKKKNASRIDISYLITVWTKDIMDEHRLLWSVLATLFRYNELPEEILPEELRQMRLPVKASAAQPDGLFNNPADFWSALDNEIKPSISYVVTVPLDPNIIFQAPTVKTKILEFKPPDTAAERLTQIHGHVHQAGRPAMGISAAQVLISGSGMTVTTDSQGYYSFSGLDEGEYTFQVHAPGKKPKEISISIPGATYDLEI